MTARLPRPTLHAQQDPPAPVAPARESPPARRAEPESTGGTAPGPSASEASADQVLSASPNPIVAVDEAGRIAYANPRAEQTFGWTASELVGQPVEILIPNRLSDRHVTHRASFFARASARPMGIGLDLTARRRDGSEFPVEISLAPVTTPGGSLVYATMVDITTRKALEDQLLQAQKMESIGRLAGGIAHDFNNILFAIRGYVDMLLEDLDASGTRIDTARVRPSVVAMGTAVDRATALTAQLLAFSRRQVVRPVVVDLRDAVTTVEPMLRRVIGEQVRLVLALDPATGQVRVDPGQLDQVLLNLAVNARDAMPRGGTITIETANVLFDEPYAVEHFEVEPGSYVMLAMSDTGHGMDVETRRHVFEPLFTTKEPGKGTGLGLATIYGVVRQAGGHIWLYSEPGRGTTFKVYFPRADGPAEPAAPAGAPQQKVRGTVLLVEDEPTVRDISRQALERAGYGVLPAGDPREALAVIESAARIDALLTDVVMPDVSGIELARRSMEIRPDVGVVLLSGYAAETAEIEELVGRGARFASKPIATRDLVRMVAESINEAARRA